MANRLSDAASPYLLQHKDNPVAWQPWDDEALAEAQAADKPILLSIGYAACHWCHVMAHESFENEAIAELMNEHFVCIKVDREERPDLDHIYQHALALLGQQGGWPLTMFLTPAGEPFWGGTYFPPEARYGRPGFNTILESVSRIWREERSRALGNVGPLRDALGSLGASARGSRPSGELARRSARRIADAFDSANGGLAGAPKFPQAPILALLWQQARRTGDPDLRHNVLHTLARMSQGGIYDHLAGGFARYAVDEIWLVPHFEKMLYDNALLIRLLADAWADTREPLFQARVRETIGWLEREMRVPGGFASSLDADSEGEEGRYYVWTADEIDEVLGPDAVTARIAYGVTAKGNWEGRNILHRLHQHGLSNASDERRLRDLADRLLARRGGRPGPARDDKLLADWNGLTIQALARSAAVFDQSEWLTLAKHVFAEVCRNLGRGPTIRHAGRGDRRLEIGFLDDYAFMTDAALTLFAVTGRQTYADRALAWVDELERNFRSDTGAYFQAPVGTPHLLVRACSATDGPTPAGNGIMVGVLVRLAIITGDGRLQARAGEIAQAFGDDAGRNPAGYSSLLRNACLLEEPVQVVIIGNQDDPATAALRRAAAGHADPDLVVVPLTTTDGLAPDHPAAGKSTTAGRPTAYACRGPVCQPPVTEPEALVEQLEPQPGV